MRFADPAAYLDFWRAGTRHSGRCCADPRARRRARYIEHDLVHGPRGPGSVAQQRAVLDADPRRRRRPSWPTRETHAGLRTRRVEHGVRAELVWGLSAAGSTSPRGSTTRPGWRRSTMSRERACAPHEVDANHYDVILGDRGVTGPPSTASLPLSCTVLHS